MQNRLSLLKIKISELAEYLNITRPTLYKFIELYETNKTSELRKKFVDLFDFITNTQCITKIDVIKYIINNFYNKQDDVLLNQLSNLINVDKQAYDIFVKLFSFYQNLNTRKEKNLILTKLKDITKES